MENLESKAKMGLNLSTKISISVLLSLFVVMAAGSFMIIRRQRAQHIKQMKQESDIITNVLEHTLTKVFTDEFRNKEYIQRITEELGKTIGVDQIEIYDLNRIVIADTNREEIGEMTKGQDALDVIKVIETGKSVTGTELKEGKEVYTKCFPVHIEKEGKKELVGVAEVVMDLEAIEQRLSIKQEAEILATIVQFKLQKMMVDKRRNADYLQMLTEDLGRQSGVSQIEIYDTTRKVIADTDRNELGQIASGEDAEDLIEVLKARKTVIGFKEKEGEEVYSKTLPICARLGEKEELAGALEVSMSVPYIQSLIASTRNELMLLTIIKIVFVSLITILLLRKSVISPILSLAGVTKLIAKGDLNKRASVKSKDEIGELAASFNQMTDEIQKRDEELQTMNEELRSSNEEFQTSNEELQSTTEELEASNEELRTTQEELVQKEKLAAVGQLASGVGHELRNPLGVIKNAAYYIKTKVGEKDPKLAKHIGIMEKEITNSNKIISDLLGFSSTRPPAISAQDINKVLEDTLEVVEVPENVKLIKELGQDLPKAMADPDQMRQVFVNLALNAVQAMAEGGKLKIVTRRKDDFIETEFSDTGCGISEENLHKLFDPFFTTKARGIGLGLAVTQGIIERHNGTIEVKNKAGKGTIFVVKLPIEKKGA